VVKGPIRMERKKLQSVEGSLFTRPC